MFGAGATLRGRTFLNGEPAQAYVYIDEVDEEKSRYCETDSAGLFAFDLSTSDPD